MTSQVTVAPPVNSSGTGRRIARRRSKKMIAFGWYGGKFSHLDFLLPLIPHDATHFCDVFGGSAAVLLNLEPYRVETYNDLDSELVNFFETLRNQGTRLIKAIGLTPFSREELVRACIPEKRIVETGTRPPILHPGKANTDRSGTNQQRRPVGTLRPHLACGDVRCRIPVAWVRRRAVRDSPAASKGANRECARHRSDPAIRHREHSILYRSTLCTFCERRLCGLWQRDVRRRSREPRQCAECRSGPCGAFRISNRSLRPSLQELATRRCHGTQLSLRTQAAPGVGLAELPVMDNAEARKWLDGAWNQPSAMPRDYFPDRKP